MNVVASETNPSASSSTFTLAAFVDPNTLSFLAPTTSQWTSETQCDGASFSTVPINANTTLTGGESPFLKFASGVLQPGRSYCLRATVTDPGKIDVSAQRGSGYVTFTVKSVPSNGRCVPTKPLVNNTLVLEPFTESLQVQCSNWITDASAGSLFYTLEGRTVSSNQSDFRSLLSLSKSSNMMLTLPPGLYQLRPRIVDSLGSSAATQPFFIVNVTASAPTNATTDTSVVVSEILQNATRQFQSSGNGAQLLNALSSVVLSFQDKSANVTQQTTNQKAVLSAITNVVTSNAIQNDGESTATTLSLISNTLASSLQNAVAQSAALEVANKAATAANLVVESLSSQSVTSTDQINDISSYVFNIANKVVSTTAPADKSTPVQNTSTTSLLVNQMVDRTVGIAASNAACGQTVADSTGSGTNLLLKAASRSIVTAGSTAYIPITSSLEDFSTTVQFTSLGKASNCPTYVMKKVNSAAFGYPSTGLSDTQSSSSSTAADSFVYGWKLVDKVSGASVSDSRQQITFKMTSTPDFTNTYGLASGAVYAAKCGFYNYTTPGDATTALLDTDTVTTVGQTNHANGTFTLTCRSNTMGDYAIAAVPADQLPTPTGTDTPQRNDGGASASNANSLLWVLLIIPIVLV